MIVYDRLFLYPLAVSSWRILCALFVGAASLALWPAPLRWLTDRLGIGRPVDGVIYVAIVLLIRELFLHRIRARQVREELTRLARAIALQSRQSQELWPAPRQPR